MTLSQIEQTKYERVWAKDEYQIHSPGESVQETALRFMNPSAIYDFGCGQGKSVTFFNDHGFDATGVDFVNVLEDPTTPFIKQCLWEDQGLIPVQYGFCCDVMEHIPTEKVELVLENISRTVTLGCFFQIALFPDSMGAMIGETLHLSVFPSAWWKDRQSKYFYKTEIVQDDNLYLTGMFSH